MENVNILKRYGLFDAKVPRYTSYPPANRFVSQVGADVQESWLTALPTERPVSIYVHIPFCRRLCWFCACRTQGTSSQSPVQAYVADLIDEIKAIAARSPKGLTMARLHLGGGTPTLLSADLMNQLLDCLFQSFPKYKDFEFSVEIDPTEAAPEVLEVLSNWGMKRASVGVQDFEPKVQKAIGRMQSFEATKDVIDQLRRNGVESLNVDLLYGLPHQTKTTLIETLDRVASLRPDRLALYGYAHVPHVSKRQVMIPDEALPNAESRFLMSQVAQSRLAVMGYEILGIDHFALPSDSLAQAAKTGTMRRNFQGYTDDPCETLIGFGASAISKFPQGYLQNTVATAAYRRRVQTNGLAANKGHVMSEDDRLVAEMINAIMCDGQIDIDQTIARFKDKEPRIKHMLDDLKSTYPDATILDEKTLKLAPGMEALTRIFAAHLDQNLMTEHIHSIAV